MGDAVERDFLAREQGVRRHGLSESEVGERGVSRTSMHHLLLYLGPPGGALKDSVP